MYLPSIFPQEENLDRCYVCLGHVLISVCYGDTTKLQQCETNNMETQHEELCIYRYSMQELFS